MWVAAVHRWWMSLSDAFEMRVLFGVHSLSLHRCSHWNWIVRLGLRMIRTTWRANKKLFLPVPSSPTLTHLDCASSCSRFVYVCKLSRLFLYNIQHHSVNADALYVVQIIREHGLDDDNQATCFRRFVYKMLFVLKFRAVEICRWEGNIRTIPIPSNIHKFWVLSPFYLCIWQSFFLCFVAEWK